jgi:flagellar biogenesis protein FliO
MIMSLLSTNFGLQNWRRTLRWLGAAGKALRKRQATQKLRLCETVSLGEHRFVAVVQFEEQRFLLGGSANAISLLTALPSTTNGNLHEAA